MGRIRPRGVWKGRAVAGNFPGCRRLAAGALRWALCVEEELLRWLDWHRHPLPPLPHHRVLVAGADLDRSLLDGRTPLPHQRSGARWLLARRGALLADEMGLGKTLTALLAARALMRAVPLRLMVIAPVGLHPHWRREAAALDLEFSLHSWAKLPVELPEAGTCCWWMKRITPNPCRRSAPRRSCGWRGIPACGRCGCSRARPFVTVVQFSSFRCWQRWITRLRVIRRPLKRSSARDTGVSAVVSDAGAPMVPVAWKSCVVSPAPGAAPPEAVGARSSGEDAAIAPGLIGGGSEPRAGSPLAAGGGGLSPAGVGR